MTVGYIVGGHTENVIPESVTFGGTYRSLTSAGLVYLQKRIQEVFLMIVTNIVFIITMSL